MTISLDRSVVYPDSDGQPMADNTLQFQWIVLLKENLEILFSHDPQVFVAGDLLWHPVEGHPEIRVAPDVLVAFGRPKGYRGSYKQWQEDGVIPQVVFEILSPGNTVKEMAKKQVFYSFTPAMVWRNITFTTQVPMSLLRFAEKRVTWR